MFALVFCKHTLVKIKMTTKQTTEFKNQIQQSELAELSSLEGTWPNKTNNEPIINLDDDSMFKKKKKSE